MLKPKEAHGTNRKDALPAILTPATNLPLNPSNLTLIPPRILTHLQGLRPRSSLTIADRSQLFWGGKVLA